MYNPFADIANRMGFSRSINSMSLESWAKRNRYKPPEYSDKDLEEADSVHAYIYGAIERIANSIASTPISLYRDKERIENHKALALVQDPSRFMTESGLKESITKHLLLTGDCFIEIVVNKNKYEDGRVAIIPENLIPVVPPSSMKIVPGEKQLIDHYEYLSPSGEKLELGAREIAHLRLFSASQKLYGLSPLQAIKEELVTDVQAVEYNKQFFDNSAAPGGVLSSEQSLNPDAKDDIEDRWNNAHQGPSQAHKVAVLGRGMEYQPVGLSQEDMQYIQSREMTKEYIRALYGVPATYLGETSATYASAEEASKAFFLNTVIPMANRIAQGLTKYVLGEYWSDKKLAYDFNFLANEALVPLVQEKAQLQKTLISAGIPPNMATKMIWGQEFYGEDIGDTSFLPANLVPMGSVPTSVKEPGPQLSVGVEGDMHQGDISEFQDRWKGMMSKAGMNLNNAETDVKELEYKIDELLNQLGK